MSTSLVVLGAVLLDWLVGEPRRLHPLVGFGRLATLVEGCFYGTPGYSPGRRRWRGLLVLALLLPPLTAMAAGLSHLPYGEVFSLSILYLAIAHRSLHEHAEAVGHALRRGDGAEARRLAGLMVSRDTADLEICAATTESVLENGNDGVFGAIFWFVVAGAPGCLFYRLANTLDAMWGYRNRRYREFGWAAARLDDLLNYLPARLTALSYTLLGRSGPALDCWRTQAAAWESPNAGPVMAAGAGALGVSLGGPTRYQGCLHHRPRLGLGESPRALDIVRALGLVRATLGMWLGLLLFVALLSHA
ncbi:MAG: adenosylcobinamide-phosphate synthase CbiB [Candidatus Thiodiazotropha sp.]